MNGHLPRHTTSSFDGSVINKTLDQAARELTRGNIKTAQSSLIGATYCWKYSTTHEQWQTLIKDIIRPHPVTELVQQDPFVARAFQKPRGYPGDAALMDIIYDRMPDAEVKSPVTELGLEAFKSTMGHAAPTGVRWRRQFIAKQIDNVWLTQDEPRILSIACGHMRELDLTSDVKSSPNRGHFHALDQDPDSLERVTNSYLNLNITPLHLPVWDFCMAPPKLEPFDLAYSAGLFDYLSDRVAAFVLEAMLDTVRTGGKVLIINFTPKIPDVGYMEAFMDWWLIYRTKDDLARLLPKSFTGKYKTLLDPTQQLAIVELTKNN